MQALIRAEFDGPGGRKRFALKIVTLRKQPQEGQPFLLANHGIPQGLLTGKVTPATGDKLMTVELPLTLRQVQHVINRHGWQTAAAEALA